jgi:transposase InsO family protein
MPWREVSAMSERQELIALASVEGNRISDLCARFGISRFTAYKWLARYDQEGPAGLAERPRRPRHSPRRTPPEVEAVVLQLRDEHPVWGGRKLRARLLHLGHQAVPSPSTITAILHRHGRIDPNESLKHHPWHRFEHPEPNALWQMDFKGHIPLANGRCHPLTVLDDHSRFALGLEACSNELSLTVHERLTAIFRRYGLPWRMVMDNGSPWSGGERVRPHSTLTVWLMRLGIRVSHGRPYHPQTQGKDERFHRTLKAELLQGNTFSDLLTCQRAFDRWRTVYNVERPHEALDLAPPVSRYRLSPRGFPEALPPIAYDDGELVRKVQEEGFITFRGKHFRISKAFRGYPVALRPTPIDGVWSVWFMTHRVAQVDLKESEPLIESVSDVSEHV